MISIKTDQEIILMQENGRILSAILNKVKHQAKPGVSTEELASIADAEMKSFGVIPAFLGYKGFPSVICTSLNSEVVHGIPNQQKILKNGDILKLDIGIKRNGFFADMAETIYIGEIFSPEIKHLVDTTKRALEAGITNAHAGNTLGKISQSIQKCIESSSLSVIQRYVGHGIGKELHEKPPVPNFGSDKSGPILKSGMVIAIEPIACLGKPEVFVLEDGWTSVTNDGSLSAHFEHTVAITDDGPKILTSTCQAG